MIITVFCRGHGFGHASRSLRLVAALQRRGHKVDVVSYGYGAEYFRMMGVECVDAGIVDRRDFAPEAVAALAGLLPGLAGSELFVVDELHYLPPVIREHTAAPIVMLTDWLFAERDLGVDTVLYPARRTLVVDFAEAHPLDPYTASRVEFVGPVAPPLLERRRAPAAVADATGRRIVMTLGGSTSNPASLRMLKSLVPQVLEWARGDDELLILGDDPTAGALTDRRVRWLGRRPDAAEILAGADLAVCNGNGMTTCELAYLGVPTIASLAPVYGEVHDPVSVRRTALLARYAPFAVTGPEATEGDFARLAERVLGAGDDARLAELRSAYISPDALGDLVLEDRSRGAFMDERRKGGEKV
ncbi:glycosyltransferase [Microbacterium sp. NPDC055599]